MTRTNSYSTYKMTLLMPLIAFAHAAWHASTSSSVITETGVAARAAAASADARPMWQALRAGAQTVAKTTQGGRRGPA